MPMRNKVRWMVFPPLILIALLSLKFVYGGGFFRWTSICEVCGAEQNTTEILWLFPWHRFKDTPLSEFVRREDIQGVHTHQWLFCQGGGNGILCALGSAHNLLSIVQDQSTQRFLGAVKRFKGPEEARVWLQKFLEPKQSDNLRSFFHPEQDDIKDKQSFNGWLEAQTLNWKEFQQENQVMTTNLNKK